MGLYRWALLPSRKLSSLPHLIRYQGQKINDMLEHLAVCTTLSPDFQQDFSRLIPPISAFSLIYLLISYPAKICVFAPTSTITTLLVVIAQSPTWPGPALQASAVKQLASHRPRCCVAGGMSDSHALCCTSPCCIFVFHSPASGRQSKQ